MPEKKLIIEATLHELVPKEYNPNVPYGPEEVAADAAAGVEAGLSLLHFHARDRETGAQRWTDVACYQEALRLIRARGVPADLPWYPTYQGLSPGFDKEASLAHLGVLARDPNMPLRIAAIDVGSGNLNAYDPVAKRFDRPEHVKALPHAVIRYFFDLCREHGLRPYLGIYEPGHLRHIAAYLDLGWLEPPLLMKFFFTDYGPYGMPPHPRAVEMYAELLDLVLPGVEREWLVQCYGHAIWPLAEAAIALGGHVRVGLGDYHPWYWPDPTGEQATNAELVARAAALGRAAGRAPATSKEARALLKLPD